VRGVVRLTLDRSFVDCDNRDGVSVSPKATWSFEPGVLLFVLAVGWVYVSWWRRARATREPHRPGFGRLALFMGGLAAVLAALVSPIDSLGSQLMMMHMVQHILLLDIAPILAILGLTKVLLRPATRRLTAIERKAGFLAHPAVAVAAYAGFMWLWHIPAMYDLALRHTNIHALEHICFGVAGFLYWWHLISPIRSRLRLGGMGPVLYMTSTKLLVGALGILLAFAPSDIYPFYAHHPHYWGLTPGEDQNLAGVIMALEQSMVMGIVLVVLFVQMLTESEREAQRQERFEAVS
jgi:cytochrome c oxidase assembly factor CtaG